MHDATTERCLDMVWRSEADFCICAQRGSEAEFENILLFKERYYLICQSDDPLAKGREVKLSDLKGRHFVHMVRTGTVRRQMIPLLESAQVSDSGLEVANFGTVAGLVAAGFGISIVPEHAVRLCHREGLVSVPLQCSKAVRPVVMIRRKGRSMSVAALAFWNQLEGNRRSIKR